MMKIRHCQMKTLFYHDLSKAKAATMSCKGGNNLKEAYCDNILGVNLQDATILDSDCKNGLNIEESLSG